MSLTPAQESLLPSDDDVRFYNEHGWYHSKPLFSADEIADALRGSEEFYAGKIDECALPLPEGVLPKGTYSGLRKNDYASFLNRALATLTRSALLGAVAGRLAGTSEIRLWHDQLLYKPPADPTKPTNVGWHTDRGYWKTCTSPKMLTAWIPFHDCDEQMGTICMIDGSHKWPDNTQALDFFSSDLEGLEKRFDTGGNPVVKVPINLKLGEVSFHNCLTIHGSGPNHRDTPRRSIAVHLQDESNRWQEYHFPDGRLAHHTDDTLCRKIDGKPDYTDPAVCPALWRQL